MGMATERALAAKAAWPELSQSTNQQRNRALHAMADGLVAGSAAILRENALDLQRAEGHYTKALMDRLTLTEGRLAAMAQGLREIAALPDPIGQVESMWYNADGLQIGRTRVPLGVVGVIYEARPNVTADAAGLCVKSGNCIVLRGGKEALASNAAIAASLRDSLAGAGMNPEIVQFISDPSRDQAAELMRLNGILDVLIPRGGASLIRSVVETASVPTIQTGVGNCHTYLDQGCDHDMAVAIAVNAKAQRPSVCNAMETLLVHRQEPELLLRVLDALEAAGVRIRGCAETCALWPKAEPATEADWETEYNDYILAVKVVGDMDEAIRHIEKYGSKHSEAIVTRDYARARQFQSRVDAAAVYVNASTRFTDGGVFGFGAEIGISNQKLHARGPVGVAGLTTVKYIINGDGQVRG